MYSVNCDCVSLPLVNVAGVGKFLNPFSPDILLNVFLAIAVDNLADADALGDAEEEEGKEGEEV